MCKVENCSCKLTALAHPLSKVSARAGSHIERANSFLQTTEAAGFLFLIGKETATGKNMKSLCTAHPELSRFPEASEDLKRCYSPAASVV